MCLECNADVLADEASLVQLLSLEGTGRPRLHNRAMHKTEGGRKTPRKMHKVSRFRPYRHWRLTHPSLSISKRLFSFVWCMGSPGKWCWQLCQSHVSKQNHSLLHSVPQAGAAAQAAGVEGNQEGKLIVQGHSTAAPKEGTSTQLEPASAEGPFLSPLISEYLARVTAYRLWRDGLHYDFLVLATKPPAKSTKITWNQVSYLNPQGGTCRNLSACPNNNINRCYFIPPVTELNYSLPAFSASLQAYSLLLPQTSLL